MHEAGTNANRRLPATTRARRRSLVAKPRHSDPERLRVKVTRNSRTGWRLSVRRTVRKREESATRSIDAEMIGTRWQPACNFRSRSLSRVTIAGQRLRVAGSIVIPFVRNHRFGNSSGTRRRRPGPSPSHRARRAESSVTELITNRSADFISDSTSSRNPGSSTALQRQLNLFFQRAATARRRHEMRVRHSPQDERHGVDQIFRPLCPSAPTLASPELRAAASTGVDRRGRLAILSTSIPSSTSDAPGGDAVLTGCP